MAMRGCVWTLRAARTGRTWTRGTHSGTRLGSAEVPQIQFIDFVGVEAEPGYFFMRQTTETFGRCSSPWVCSRAVCAWKNGAANCSLFEFASEEFFLCQTQEGWRGRRES